MNDDLPDNDLPDDVRSLIGQPCYERAGDLPVEVGAIRLLLGSVESADPRGWDADPVAPASALTMWAKPLPWTPGAAPVPPLRLHEDLKARFGLPSAVMSECSMIFHRPVRAGERLHNREVLRSVSAPKRTGLGTGRFWTIDVEVHDRDGDLIGVETSTAFAYRGTDA